MIGSQSFEQLSNLGKEVISPNNLLLSIAIPTYNRPDKLSCLLDSILCQYSPGMSLEIVVSDNSPDRTTADLIDRYKCCLPIRYVHHLRNIGGCRNFVFSVSASNASYCWLIGDDDMIVPGSISSILSVLSREPAVLGIVCGYSYQHEESRSQVKAGLANDSLAMFDTPNFLSATIDQLVEKWEDTFFFTNLPALHTSILSCVFNRQLWLQHISMITNKIPANDIPISDEFDSLDTIFPHALTWARMFIGRPVYVISRPMAYLFYGGQDWFAKWPALMFTRCLDLADFFDQLGGDSAAISYYKSLILKDPSLHGLVLLVTPTLNRFSLFNGWSRLMLILRSY
jgi:glycosyltransferase involved in cell wall biosynthesis